MNSPATFVSDRIEQFGILGANNALREKNERDQLPPCTCEFTSRNHFRFGFDDGEFNRRESSTAKYWVEFGKPSRPHQGVRQEFTSAVSEISDLYGPLSVSNSGDDLSRAVIAAAENLGLSIEQVTVEIKDHGVPPHDEVLPHCRHQVTWDEFVDFAVKFCKVAGCSEPWIAFEAYHGHLSKRTHIYPVAQRSLRNNNWDKAENRIVGPPNWSCVDGEWYTAINRWLLASRQTGIVQIRRWSPELGAAILDSKAFRAWLREASNPSRSLTAQLSGMPSVLQEAFPNAAMPLSGPAGRNDPVLNQRMSRLRTRLRRANPGYNGSHHYPLHRLIEHFGVTYDFYFGQTAQTYGHVVV